MSTWAGCEIRRLETVDSTNAEARRWARAGAPHGAVVVAGTQTQGRGRRGRDWASAPGAGLWFSMVLRPEIPLAQWTMLPFAAALAGADACEAVLGEPVGIKWPNDLVLRGRKIAGLLVEREGDAAVMGIGVNVSQRAEDFPVEIREKAGSLVGLTGRAVSLAALETALVAAVAARVEDLSFWAEYARRCVTLGAEVEVVGVDSRFLGVAEGVDGDGALLVRTEDGDVRRVLAGDVSVRGLMGYV